jgi:hypothetical protein
MIPMIGQIIAISPKMIKNGIPMRTKEKNHDIPIKAPIIR